MVSFRTLLAASLLTALILAPAAPAGADPAPQPPGAPGDLRVTAITPVSVTLSWTASTGGCCALDGYVISYSQAFNDVFWAQQVGDVTTATITSSILPTRQYRFSVLARDVAGHTSPGAPSVTVVTPATSTAADQTPPSAPAGLRLTGLTSAGAALTWSRSADDVGVAGYNVYHFDGWYTSTLVGTPTGTCFTAPVVGSSTGRHLYYVRARDAAGNLSIASGTVTVPAAPPPAARR